jgi:hypothetical protein
MDWFLTLLASTVFVRGMGAGIIYDVALVSLSIRNDIGTVAYARYARTLFQRGFKHFFAVSMAGALLTVALVVSTFIGVHESVVRWSTAVALGATALAFAATARALPAVMELRRLPDDGERLAPALDRFARWHRPSTAGQVSSFVALIVALCAYPGR